MRIGILTFYNVANFGANLQALSMYRYLENLGHIPIFINYNSNKESSLHHERMNDLQYRTHIDFVSRYIINQTEQCTSIEDVNNSIKKNNINAIIIGSDAVLQHHPLLGNIKLARRKIFYIHRFLENRMFPNPYWGIPFSSSIPTAMYSVSSQNSEYMFIMPWVRKKMKKALDAMKFISVRDVWTKKMVKYISGKQPDITPDPVFAYSENAPDTILSFEKLKEKFGLPPKYLLVSLKSQSLPMEMLGQMKVLFDSIGVSCVALTMPEGIKFKHNFDCEINPPLAPNEWFSLIKNAYGYVGSNMHPIIVSLHNGVPCVSIDNWGRTNFFHKKIDDDSSKVKHIMNEFNLNCNYFTINGDICTVSAKEVFDCINSFPIEDVKKHSLIMCENFKMTMKSLLDSLKIKENDYVLEKSLLGV